VNGTASPMPLLKKGRNGYGHAVGKWFGRYLNKIGITDPAKVIHSFRHTVVTRLTAAGVPQDMREVLVGHAAENVHGQTYVHREAIPLGLMKEHLEKLEFSALLNLRSKNTGINMPIKHVKRSALVQWFPAAFCAHCRRVADEDSKSLPDGTRENGLWTTWAPESVLLPMVC
jgi:hypothetical protein